jgi:glutamate 5-kinase
VAIDEIKFGDNDQLSAMVAPLCDAELVVLLSDVEGLLDASGGRVRFVRDPAREAVPLAGESTSGVGTGGMRSKVDAAARATFAGAFVVIASAREPRVLERVLRGDDVGTLFAPQAERLPARKHWIAYTLRPRGALLLDDGAVRALRAGGRSLLGVGVLGVRGAFEAGDAVSLVSAAGAELGRGLARYGAAECAASAGVRRHPSADDDAVFVHLDDLVLFPG